MTNDELEAYRAMLGVMDNRSLGNALRDKLPGILDEVERLRAEHAVLWERAVRDSARATRAEAHAERLASVIVRGLAMEQLPPYVRDMEGRRTTLRKEARQALSAYRGVKDEACSRPSDALDAPVADQSTTCSQPERN